MKTTALLFFILFVCATGHAYAQAAPKAEKKPTTSKTVDGASTTSGSRVSTTKGSSTTRGTVIGEKKEVNPDAVSTRTSKGTLGSGGKKKKVGDKPVEHVQ